MLREKGARLLVRREPVNQRRWLAIRDDPTLPRIWRSSVNDVEPEAQHTSFPHRMRRVLPFSNDQWTKISAVRLGFKAKTRPRVQPKKETWPTYALHSGFVQVALVQLWRWEYLR